MYCPNCGKENSEGRRFCRSCGLSLSAIGSVMNGEVQSTRTSENSSQPLSRMQAAWQNPFFYALLLIVLGIIIGAAGNRLLSSEITSDIGTIIALLGVGLLGLKGVMLVVAPPGVAPAAKSPTSAEGNSRREPARLPAEPPSVTETTTRHLDASLEAREEKSRDTQPTL